MTTDEMDKFTDFMKIADPDQVPSTKKKEDEEKAKQDKEKAKQDAQKAKEVKKAAEDFMKDKGNTQSLALTRLFQGPPI